MSIFKMKKKQDFSIHESSGGHLNYYHIAMNDKALCGRKDTIKRNILLSAWGFITHPNERYCKECERLWIEGKF